MISERREQYKIEGRLDELILSAYRIVTRNHTWSAWLDELRALLCASEIRIELNEPDAPARLLGRSSDHKQSRLEFTQKTFSVGEEHSATISIRSHDKSCNTDAIDRLLPHVERVIKLQNYLAEEHEYVEHIAAMLADGMSVGLIMLHGPAHHVAYANSMAGEIASTSAAFSIKRERLIVNDPQQASAMQAAIEDVERQTTRHGRHVVLGNHDHPLSALCYRLDRCTQNYIDGDAREFIVVFISATGELPALRADLLKQQYGLTPKESRLAIGLAQGGTLESLAGRFHVSRHTLRAQLKSVLKKTGARSQAALLRVLLDDPRLLFTAGDEDVGAQT